MELNYLVRHHTTNTNTCSDQQQTLRHRSSNGYFIEPRSTCRSRNHRSLCGTDSSSSPRPKQSTRIRKQTKHQEDDWSSSSTWSSNRRTIGPRDRRRSSNTGWYVCTIRHRFPSWDDLNVQRVRKVHQRPTTNWRSHWNLSLLR